MARIETDVRDLLAVDPTISARVEQRAFDRDYRTDGWDNAPVTVFDADRVMLPTLVVTKEEGVHPLGSPRNARRSLIVVWAFSNGSPEGYDDVQTILDAANAVLAATEESDPIPGYHIEWTGELGPYRFDDGCVGRYDFGFSGIPALGG